MTLSGPDNLNDVPKRLYKYRQVDKFTSDNFCRRVLWFSRPDSFNDPYDCVPVLDTSIDKEGLRQHLESAWAKLHPKWTRAQLIDNVKMQVEESWPLDEAEVVRFKEQYHERIRSIGVFSTSARYDSVVMWSHYSDRHRGICLELDPSTLSSNALFWPVEYREQRPVINLFRAHLEANRLTSTVKSWEWRYEQEWRLALEQTAYTPSFPCEITLPDGMVTGIILGERIVKADRDRVIDWCKLLPVCPTIYDAQLDIIHFKINRLPIA